ncbi:hypothetical protein BCR33DRAFT_647240, partial [Rhizoclosmatium globosum]
LVCVDESSSNRKTIQRSYGWAVVGERAYNNAEFVRGMRYTIIGAVVPEGLLAYDIQPGGRDGNEFTSWVEHDLLPKMNAYPGPRSVLVLDNCSIHKQDRLQEICDAHGV